MPGEKFIKNVSGVLTEVVSTQVGGGGGADKIPSLNSSGKLDVTMMPTGIAADTETVTASEALAAGDFVNVYNNAGTAAVRKADATVAGKEANGFVLAAVLNAGQATVYMEGANTQITGMTPGPMYLSTTPGLGTNTPPSASGNIVQRIGIAVSATRMNLQTVSPFTLA